MAEHLCAFLQPLNRPPPSLGCSTRIEMQKSPIRVDAARLLYYLLFYSPSPWILEKEYITELRKLPDPAGSIIDELEGAIVPSTDDWAERLSSCLPHLGSNDTSVLPALSNLSKHYFNYLGLALWNVPGKQSPEISTHLTPNLDRVAAIRALLCDVKNKCKGSLKLAVQVRDEPICPITRYPLNQSPRPTYGITEKTDGLASDLAHIIPFLPALKEAHVALETFTGATLTAEEISEFVNSPENAILLQLDAHREYDKLLAWGIEAVSESGVIHYYARAVRPKHIGPLTRSYMGQELAFGTNVLNFTDDGEQLVPLPDPRFCNMMLAVMRVLHASGAADVLDELWGDDERSREPGSSLGSSNDFDNLLVSKLSVVEMSQSIRVH